MRAGVGTKIAAVLGGASLLTVVAATACDPILPIPDVGEPLAGACDPADSDLNTNVSFEREILPVFQRPPNMAGCSCHLPTSANRIGLERTGFDVSSAAAVRRGNAAGNDIVVPGDPCGSILNQKLLAPPYGDRMPADGPPYLDANERQLIHDWIAEGAR